MKKPKDYTIPAEIGPELRLVEDRTTSTRKFYLDIQHDSVESWLNLTQTRLLHKRLGQILESAAPAPKPTPAARAEKRFLESRIDADLSDVDLGDVEPGEITILSEKVLRDRQLRDWKEEQREGKHSDA